MQGTKFLLVLSMAALAALAACGRQEADAGRDRQAASPRKAAEANWPPPRVARDFDPEQVRRGEALYDRHCAACHGPGGRGQGGDWRQRDAEGRFPPPPLDDSAHAWHHPTAVLRQVILHGSPGGTGNMPAWKDRLSEEQIADVILYIKSLWSDEVYAVWHDIERRALEQ